MSEYTEIFTIRDFVRYAVTQFNQARLYYGHGTDNTWDEAIALVLHVLSLPHDISAAIFEARLTQSERETLYKMIQRRVKERIPVPYLTHEAWFAGLSFYVDERVLIPRSPIAELIEARFQPWIDDRLVCNILDLCTGSGCIAIACANTFPEATVDASDISEDALAVCKINIARHAVEDQVTLHHSDLFESLPETKYDIIISNPPYVDATDISTLPPEYHHEPKLGLEGGTEGLDFAIKILKKAYDYLNPHGILIVEVGNSDAALAEKLPEVPFTWLEFEHGGGGVFLLTAKELRDYQEVIQKL